MWETVCTHSETEIHTEMGKREKEGGYRKEGETEREMGD